MYYARGPVRRALRSKDAFSPGLPLLFPALGSKATAARQTLSAARHASGGRHAPEDRTAGGLFRRDDRAGFGGVRTHAGERAAASRAALRGYVQFPEQDVPRHD